MAPQRKVWSAVPDSPVPDTKSQHFTKAQHFEVQRTNSRHDKGQVSVVNLAVQLALVQLAVVQLSEVQLSEVQLSVVERQ